MNPYFHYGPLCGGMTQRGKLYMKMISQWILWYCTLHKTVQNYDLKIVNRRVAYNQISHTDTWQSKLSNTAVSQGR